MAELINTAMIIAPYPSSPHDRYEQMVADAFRDAGFVVHPEKAARDHGIDFIAKRRGQAPLAVEIKAAPEGRPDRLIPLLAQAILQVRSHSGRGAAQPGVVAVVGAPRVSMRAARAVLKFAQAYAPDVAAGVLDLEGLRLFSGHGLEELDAVLPAPPPAARAVAPAAHLFSDLNQWMLKMLLARHLNRPELLGGPIGQYRNASELAAAAKVSIMSAFRFLRQLQQEGFLHESSAVLQLVRVPELLRRWQAVYQRPSRELPVRWLLPGDPKVQLANAIQACGERACLGLFAAARAHGFGHVAGVPVHVYVDHFDQAVLERMGVIEARSGESPDLVLRIPHARESVSRGQVMVAQGYRAADILQVWLDVASHPSRGQEQADLLYRRVLEHMLIGLK